MKRRRTIEQFARAKAEELVSDMLTAIDEAAEPEKRVELATLYMTSAGVRAIDAVRRRDSDVAKRRARDRTVAKKHREADVFRAGKWTCICVACCDARRAFEAGRRF